MNTITDLDLSTMTYDEIKTTQMRLEAALAKLVAVLHDREEQAAAAERAVYDKLPDVISHIRKDEIGGSFVMETEGTCFIVEMRWNKWVKFAHEVVAADAVAREGETNGHGWTSDRSTRVGFCNQAGQGGAGLIVA